jgi:N-acetylmuramoyl-L-alanine amidase
MFKIALTAGHYKYTAGKRCLKKLDKNETREWVLNNRIADKIEERLAEYQGYSLLRTDDTTGETAIELEDRIAAANRFEADVYISIHHNAGIAGGNGGGIVAYTYTKVGEATKEWQRELYEALIAATGLKGNRAQPLATANLAECRDTAMPAVLLELGFMDSATDVPVILSEDYADACAEAIVSVLVRRGGLVQKPVSNALYLVQAGAFRDKANAEKLVKALKAKGFDAIIKRGGSEV